MIRFFERNFLLLKVIKVKKGKERNSIWSWNKVRNFSMANFTKNKFYVKIVKSVQFKIKCTLHIRTAVKIFEITSSMSIAYMIKFNPFGPR